MIHKSIPSIRFKNFEDEWTQNPLKSFLTESRIVGHTGTTAKKLTVKLWGKGVVEKKDLYGGSVNTQYYVRKAGQFMYGKLDFLHAAFGIVPESLDEFESTLDSPAFDVNNIDGKFLLKTLIQEKFYIKKGMIANGSRKAKRIHTDTFLDMEINVPSINEQSRIGNYLYELDSLIEHTEQVHSKLQSLKSAMLEKMFPKAGADVPEVRFAGFTEKWKTISLSDIASEIIRTDKNSKAPIMMITAANGFIEQSKRYAFDNAGQSLEKYTLLKKGELAYNHGASKLRPFGSCFALEADEARIPYVYHCFNIDGYNPYFISRILNNKNTEKSLKKLVTSGARMDGLLNISFKEYTSIKIQVPEKGEQNKIDLYFQKHEKLISLYQQKLT